VNPVVRAWIAGSSLAKSLNLSWPGLSRLSTSFPSAQSKAWMPGIRPGMTSELSSFVTTGLDPVVHAELPHGLPDQVRQ
jgi:hypothetical protein